MDEPAPHLPHRVSAALDYLRYLDGNDYFDNEQWKKNKKVCPQEEKVKEAALDCLHKYFLGELSYGDCAPNSEFDLEKAQDQQTEEKEKKEKAGHKKVE